MKGSSDAVADGPLFCPLFSLLRKYLLIPGFYKKIAASPQAYSSVAMDYLHLFSTRKHFMLFYMVDALPAIYTNWHAGTLSVAHYTSTHKEAV